MGAEEGNDSDNSGKMLRMERGCGGINLVGFQANRLIFSAECLGDIWGYIYHI